MLTPSKLDERIQQAAIAIDAFIQQATHGAAPVKAVSDTLARALRKQFEEHGRDVRHACVEAAQAGIQVGLDRHGANMGTKMDNIRNAVAESILNVEVK